MRKLGFINTISAQVRFARRRFGHCEVIDFVAILLGNTLDKGKPGC